MTVETVIQLINGVGFPIAACIALGAYVMISKKAEIKTLGEGKAAIENNSSVIKMLVDIFLNGDDKDDA